MKQKKETEIVRVTFRMLESLHRKLKVEAAMEGRTMNDIVIELIEKWLKTKKKKEK